MYYINMIYFSLVWTFFNHWGSKYTFTHKESRKIYGFRSFSASEAAWFCVNLPIDCNSHLRIRMFQSPRIRPIARCHSPFFRGLTTANSVDANKEWPIISWRRLTPCGNDSTHRPFCENIGDPLDFRFISVESYKFSALLSFVLAYPEVEHCKYTLASHLEYSLTHGIEWTGQMPKANACTLKVFFSGPWGHQQHCKTGVRTRDAFGFKANSIDLLMRAPHFD